MLCATLRGPSHNCDDSCASSKRSGNRFSHILQRSSETAKPCAVSGKRMRSWGQWHGVCVAKAPQFVGASCGDSEQSQHQKWIPRTSNWTPRPTRTNPGLPRQLSTRSAPHEGCLRRLQTRSTASAASSHQHYADRRSRPSCSLRCRCCHNLNISHMSGVQHLITYRQAGLRCSIASRHGQRAVRAACEAWSDSGEPHRTRTCHPLIKRFAQLTARRCAVSSSRNWPTSSANCLAATEPWTEWPTHHRPSVASAQQAPGPLPLNSEPMR